MPRKLTLTVTHRGDGRVCKRIDGEYVTWPDEETARAELVELIRRRSAGVATGTVPALPADPPLRDIANAFRASRKPQVAPGTWDDYETAIDQFLASVGKYRRVADLAPGDFAAVRGKWAAKLGPWKLDNRVQCVRTMFNWAHLTARLTDRLPWYGESFSKTSAAEKRRVRREHAAEHGERKFTPAELKKILASATGPLRAFVLLALNCGMYAADIAQLRHHDLRREGRHLVIDDDRGKTGIVRRAILWPETVKAIEGLRRGEDLLFVTAHGNPWVNGETDSIGLLFRRLLDELGVKRAGVGFGSLKHTHVSAVGGHPDLNAARLVRGHKFSGIEAHYDFPDLKRIKAVTDLARKRLLTNAGGSSNRNPRASSGRSPTRIASKRDVRRS
jgi:integrase